MKACQKHGLKPRWVWLSAVLRSSGQRVVIKVLKPGVEGVLQTDLNFLYIASKVLEFLNPELSRVSLVGVVGDVRASMLEETDFAKEAQHLAEFSNYLDASGMRRVATCPYVYKQFTTRRCAPPVTAGWRQYHKY